MAVWTFTQTGRPNPKTLRLDGYSAPFGRARQKPVVTDHLVVQIQKAKYPATNENRTYHVFGYEYDDMELSGRWMTRHLAGDATADSVASDWLSFIKDEAMCRIDWGSYATYKGLISELTLARESEHEIAWTMKIIVDSKEDNKSTKPPSKVDGWKDNTDYLKSLIADGVLQVQTPNDLTPDFLDSLENAIASINSISANLNKLVAQVDTIEKRTFGAMQSFRAGLNSLRTAFIHLGQTINNAQQDTVYFARTTERDLKWSAYQASQSLVILAILDVIAELDRQANLIGRKDTGSKRYVAVEGDTWESISIASTGGPERATEIASMNGAVYANPPTPGVTYLTP